MARHNQRRHRITDIPTAPTDARADEIAAIDAAPELVAKVRAAGGTLTVRIEGQLTPGARSIVYHFHSLPHDSARKLMNAEVAAWDSCSRLLTVPGKAPRYCRTPAEAVAAGLVAIEDKRKHGVRPLASRIRYGRNVDPKSAFVGGRLVNRKVLPE